MFLLPVLFSLLSVAYRNLDCRFIVYNILAILFCSFIYDMVPYRGQFVAGHHRTPPDTSGHHRIPPDTHWFVYITTKFDLSVVYMCGDTAI